MPSCFGQTAASSLYCRNPAKSLTFAPTASRAALVGLPKMWAADALPLRAETHCLFAANVPANVAALRTVVVVWQLLDVDPSSGTLSQLAAARG